ncbi:MAG: 4Fe-4S dicluster domain-containing protein [Bacteroidales bacterium]|nr:4Fe-4S dicluster domain-containing protein [Bacteroidales bacterium]
MKSIMIAAAQSVTPSGIIDRYPNSYNHFVLPFVIGISFIIVYLLIGLIRVLYHLTGEDRMKLLKSLFIPKTALKNIRDIFCDCLIHTKIWKRKPLLGYMHSAIAFGWFMLIVLGHLEVALFAPRHLEGITEGSLYYPIFYRFFIWINPAHETLRGTVFFFLMDFFLLYVLSGIALAMFKRVRSIALGMRHTTKPSLADRVALYSLWAIFPLRLLAEGFTADLSGGSFLTKPVNWMFKAFFGNELNFMPTWWAYSICLGLFFLAMPFSRYMHILTEPLLILFRNAGLKVRKPRKGFAEAEIYACSSCGLCIDACPMNTQKKNLKYSSVYFIRFLRRHNNRKINEIADKCLMCGKCAAICPVGVNSPEIRRVQRETLNNNLKFDYSYLDSTSPAVDKPEAKDKILYFAGCMSHLTPKIIKSVESILKASGNEYEFMDKDKGICCGRPLMLSGKTEAARKTIEANKKLIEESGCTTLLVSCPICLKVFKEEYNLKGIRVIHYTQFVDDLVKEGRLSISKTAMSLVYHDPCELGRGCGIYDEPRHALESIGELKKAPKERDESMCCGYSLGSLTLDDKDRGKIAESTVENLLTNKPDCIVTACPMCYRAIRSKSTVPVKDFAEIFCDNIKL